MIKKSIKWLIISGLVLVFLAAIVSVLMRLTPFEARPLGKGYRLLVVRSGSMSPTIDTGSVILVKGVEPVNIKVGDIISYRTPVSQNLITHRVIKVLEQDGLLSFKTKGDANDAPDAWAVNARDIVGRTGFIIPYLGYFINFTKTTWGFMLLIILPAVIIIIGEVRNILKGMKESGSAEKKSA